MDFVPTIATLAAFAAAVVALTFTPGPDMALFLGKAVAQGRSAGLAAMLGAMAGILVHTTLVAIGLSALLAASVTAFTLLKVVGALYLLWLAFDTVRRGSALHLDTEMRGPAEPFARLWLKGFAINLLNPKVIVFFATFLPQFVAAGDPEAARKLIFLGLFFVAIAAPLCATMILFAARLAGRLKRSPALMRAIDWAFAGVFGAFALRLLFSRPS